MSEERASLFRQGAGNYANLCGVLTGFVAVILVLVLTPGFSEEKGTFALEFVTVLFSISAFGYLVTALGFIHISSTSLQDYESIEDMRKNYAFNQVLVLVFTAAFLGGVVVLTFSVGSFYIAITVFVGLLLVVTEVARNWWILAKRSPPRKAKQ